MRRRRSNAATAEARDRYEQTIRTLMFLFAGVGIVLLFLLLAVMHVSSSSSSSSSSSLSSSSSSPTKTAKETARLSAEVASSLFASHRAWSLPLMPVTGSSLCKFCSASWSALSVGDDEWCFCCRMVCPMLLPECKRQGFRVSVCTEPSSSSSSSSSHTTNSTSTTASLADDGVHGSDNQTVALTHSLDSPSPSESKPEAKSKSKSKSKSIATIKKTISVLTSITTPSSTSHLEPQPQPHPEPHSNDTSPSLSPSSPADVNHNVMIL